METLISGGGVTRDGLLEEEEEPASPPFPSLGPLAHALPLVPSSHPPAPVPVSQSSERDITINPISYSSDCINNNRAGNDETNRIDSSGFDHRQASPFYQGPPGVFSRHVTADQGYVTPSDSHSTAAASDLGTPSEIDAFYDHNRRQVSHVVVYLCLSWGR